MNTYSRFIFALKKYWIIIAIALLVLLALIVVYSNYRNSYKKDTQVTIILSPHFDDAVLSLGGLLAKKESPVVVATFFTGKPEHATSTDWDKNSGFNSSDEAEAARVIENANALRTFNAVVQNYDYTDFQYGRTEVAALRFEIAKDIQTLIAVQADKEIDVYGPAIFSTDITHPDHELIHQAFLDVAKDYPNPKVRFFIYEDFPYAKRFAESSSVLTLQKNLEKDSGLLFKKVNITLSSSQVKAKISSLQKYSSQLKAFNAVDLDIIKASKEYTETRCGTNPRTACEVVYEIVRF